MARLQRAEAIKALKKLFRRRGMTPKIEEGPTFVFGVYHQERTGPGSGFFSAFAHYDFNNERAEKDGKIGKSGNVFKKGEEMSPISSPLLPSSGVMLVNLEMGFVEK